MPEENLSTLWARLIELIERLPNIAVSSHIHPDGDAIGSVLAFSRMMKDIGKEVSCVMAHPAGRQLELFCKPGEILQLGVDEVDLAGRNLLVMLDAGAWNRLGKVGDLFAAHPATKACIDHHPAVGDFPGLRIVDSSASSTTVLLHRFLRFLSLKLTREIAEALYLGLIVDTINFHLPNTTEEAHLIAAECLAAGVKPAEVYQPVFGTMRFARMRLMSEAFQNAEVLFDGRVGFMCTTLAMMERSGADEDDDDGFSDLTRNIEGVRVGVYLRELPGGKVKVSWRAKEPYSIVEIAQAFGGGGHVRAAGALIGGTLEQVKKQVVEKVAEHVDAGAFD